MMRALVLMLVAGPGWGAELYVAADGDDAAAGSKARPFATLERARDEIRNWKTARGPVTVFVRRGIYALPRTLQLDARDSGAAGAPVVWRAYPGETAVLSGGVPVTGFTVHKGSILKAQVPAGMNFRQLFYQGKRQPLARYPNFDASNPYGGGWAYADGKPVPMYAEVPGEDKRTFTYKVEDARQWARPEEGEIFIFPRYNWWNNIVRIRAIDREKRAITLTGDCSYPIRPGDRYYAQGLFEELDAPGEWYLDTRANTLYFWPPDGARNPTVYAPRLTTVIEIGSGAELITFRGFTVEHSSGTAVALNGTNRCLIAGNVIRNAGDYRGSGVVVNGGSQNGVAGNDIRDIGSNGIAIHGGDRITLKAAENYADNNYIHHVGVYYKQGVGVSMTGCGNRASHNLIHDTPRMAIMFSGNNLALEYNHLRHTNLETADTGAVYTGGRDWISSRGTVIRYNYMHDSLGYGVEKGRWVSPHYSWGVYLDDNTGGVDVIGNVVVRAFRGLIHLHSARDTVVENNVFVDGKLQQAEFNGWLADSRYWKTHLPTMIKGYDSVKDQPAWKRMRNMNIAPEQAVLPNGQVMTGNVFRRNIVSYRDPSSKLFSSRNLPLDRNQWDRNLYWHGGEALRITLGGKIGDVDFDGWRKAGQDANSVVADPMFVNPDKDDYRLKPNSPAFKLGFERIPVEKIGPYKSDLRASWPIVEAPGAREFPLKSEAH